MALTLRGDNASELSHDDLDRNFAEEVSLEAHGFAVGDLLKYTGAWAKAQADDSDNVADGVVVRVEDANTFWVATQDGTVVDWPSHGLGGSNGDKLWLSQSTAGGYTVGSPPATGVRQPVGKRVDGSTIIFRLGFTSMGK